MEIQGSLNAPKGQYNKFGNYRYRSCEDILAAVKPLLKKAGCVLTISDEVVMVGNRIYIKATAKLVNGGGEMVTTTAFAREEETKKGMDGSQITGAASSYARKYALNGLFAIDDTKDADTLNNNPEYTQPAQAKQPAPQQAQQQPAQQPAPQQAKQPSASELNETFNVYAKPAIEQARTAEDLTMIWEAYPFLQTQNIFVSALTARRKALGIKKANEK